ncbi:MAG: hypothetical protein WA214_13785 [Pseudolabrys sp.]
MRLPDRVLEPSERIAEILFGLIMALTVTGATSVVTADKFQIRTMLIAALGCNVAWGIIDAGMYLMARLAERGSNALLLREVRETADRESAHRIIADALPPPVRVDFSTTAAGIDPGGISPCAGFRNAPQTDRARLAGCIERLHPCYPVHFPSRDSLYCL